MSTPKDNESASMKQYIVKYYPLVDGKETEYTTTVEAEDKAAAESAIRRALAEQLERMNEMVCSLNMDVIGYNMADLPGDIEYAKHKMRVVII